VEYLHTKYLCKRYVSTYEVEKLGDKNGRLVKGRSLSTKKITVPYKCKGKSSTVAYKNEAIFPDTHGGPSLELNQNIFFSP
jgi:hypothetical protein